MSAPVRGAGVARAARRLLAPADAAMNRVYTWRYNPLYQSGPIAVGLLAIVLLTGIYLLFFYKISAPYASVARLTDQVWLGRWIRSLHRYASDAAVVAVVVHAFRMFAQGRTWGPRALAWLSGVVLLFVTLVCGWTGYVMVWDVQGLLLAREGARFLDALPLFSEPISRSFVGDRPIPNAFFFLNLFLHVALPVGLAVLLWIHVARVARPVLLPPRRLAWGLAALLLALSLGVPAALGPEADLFRTPDHAPFDWFYNFWYPVTRALPVSWGWVLVLAVAGTSVLVPILMRPPRGRRPAVSTIDPRLCTGCRTCYLDCPYEAIAMVPRADGRGTELARVDPALCVACGICSGSCAPMGAGPPGRTGRDQLTDLRAFLGTHTPTDVVLIACTNGPADFGHPAPGSGATLFPVDCAGNVHSSVVEVLLRSGFSGVLIASCPPRDCWNREGPTWLDQRLYHDREAELQSRVDKRRVRLVYAGAGDRAAVQRELQRFRASLKALGAPSRDAHIDLETSCEPVPEEAAS